MIVTSITSLIALISEVGFRGSIINNPRGESDAGFINTIWTLMIVRGFIVALVIFGISEFAHLLYPEIPELRVFLKIAAIAAFVKGFMSTKLYQNEKQMNMKSVAIIQIVTRISALCATVLFITFEPSAAAILWGEVASVFVLVGLSHWCLNGVPNRITIDRSATGTIFNYGRWILLATLMTWVLNEGHKFALGLTLSANILGFYALASNISYIVRGFISSFGDKWVFPMYAKLGNSPEMELKAFKLRVGIIALASLGIVLLVSTAEFLVDLMYEDRYADAAKFVTILCIGSIGLVINDCYIPIFKARADSFGLMKNRVVQASILAAGLYLGYELNGAEGMVIAASAASLAGGLTTAWMSRKHFVRKLFLLDSVVITIPFSIWLYLERNALQSIFSV